MSKGTILYAEDYLAIRELLEEFLKLEFFDYNHEIFKTGSELEERLNKGPDGISLVVTDNSMPLKIGNQTLPGITGYEIIQKYSQRNGFDEVPFVLLSGDFAESFSLERFPNSRYLSKNLTPNKIMSILKEILALQNPTTKLLQ